jgi:hypothetical protein
MSTRPSPKFDFPSSNLNRMANSVAPVGTQEVGSVYIAVQRPPESEGQLLAGMSVNELRALLAAIVDTRRHKNTGSNVGKRRR